MSSQPKSSWKSNSPGRVVAQHPLGDGVDDDVEHAVDPGAVAQRVDGGAQRRRPVAAAGEDRRPQRAVVAPRRVGVDVRPARRGRAPASALVNGRMYGSVSSRVP